ncbi:MAG: hypothetical protein WA705_05800 [Candidatus Ozemobacteraceae bacterium]
MMKPRNEPTGLVFLRSLFSLWMVLCAFIFSLGIPAHAQIVAADPMVRITCLPLGPNVNVNEILVKVSDDVASATGLDKNMLTYYWQTFDAMYCPAAKGDPKAKVVFVDLYVPIFLKDKLIAEVMTSMAASLAKHTGIPKEWVFIHTHFPKEGHVFIAGEIADNAPPKTPTPNK